MSQETHNAIFLKTNKNHIIPNYTKKSYNKPCVRTEEPLVLFGLGISLLIGRCANFWPQYLRTKKNNVNLFSENPT